MHKIRRVLVPLLSLKHPQTPHRAGWRTTRLMTKLHIKLTVKAPRFKKISHINRAERLKTGKPKQTNNEKKTSPEGGKELGARKKKTTPAEKNKGAQSAGVRLQFRTRPLSNQVWHAPAKPPPPAQSERRVPLLVPRLFTNSRKLTLLERHFGSGHNCTSALYASPLCFEPKCRIRSIFTR